MTEGQRPPNDPTADSLVSSESRQVERDSQLSAMFDGELSAAECELLARRLARDEALRAQWSRFSMIGAALRAERGVKLHDRVATRVQAALAQEPTYGDSAITEGASSESAAAARPTQVNTAREYHNERWLRFARPVAGVGIAATVAAVSILWLRNQEQDPALVASAPAASQNIVLQPEAASPADPVIVAAAQNEPAPVSNGEPERYITPPTSTQTRIAPPARFANYVVAHSEVSGPLARRMALLGIVGTEGSETPEQDENKPANEDQARADQARADQRRGPDAP